MSTETMSSRERIMAALRGRDVDRIPWSPCIDGYFLGGVDQVEGFGRIGADAMLRPRVRNIEDVKILTWMYEQAEVVPVPYMFDLAEKRIGDDGISTISIPGTP